MYSFNKIPKKFWNILTSKVGSKITPLVVDVGARNGMYSLDENYCKISKMVCFEPNKVEYEKLVLNKTDTSKAGIKEPEFREKHYYNYCLWEKNVKKKFYITNGAGACTLMGKTNYKDTNFFLSGRENTYEEEHTKIKNYYNVDCKKIDDFFHSDKIDFLKLDTEGSEYSILKGSINKLKKKEILFIKTEFVFFKYYRNHKVLGEIQIFLNSLGYRLIHLDLQQPQYSPVKTKIPDCNDKGLMYAGDAYFCPDFSKLEFDEKTNKRLSLISFALGFTNLGLFLQKKCSDLSDEHIKLLLGLLEKKSFLRQLIEFWKRIPMYAYIYLRKLFFIK